VAGVVSGGAVGVVWVWGAGVVTGGSVTAGAVGDVGTVGAGDGGLLDVERARLGCASAINAPNAAERATDPAITPRVNTRARRTARSRW